MTSNRFSKIYWLCQTHPHRNAAPIKPKITILRKMTSLIVKALMVLQQNVFPFSNMVMQIGCADRVDISNFTLHDFFIRSMPFPPTRPEVCRKLGNFVASKIWGFSCRCTKRQSLPTGTGIRVRRHTPRLHPALVAVWRRDGLPGRQRRGQLHSGPVPGEPVFLRSHALHSRGVALRRPPGLPGWDGRGPGRLSHGLSRVHSLPVPRRHVHPPPLALRRPAGMPGRRGWGGLRHGHASITDLPGHRSIPVQEWPMHPGEFCLWRCTGLRREWGRGAGELYHGQSQT